MSEWRSKNKMPVSELAVRFIDYYHNFNASNNAIFIDRGLTYRRFVKTFNCLNTCGLSRQENRKAYVSGNKIFQPSHNFYLLIPTAQNLYANLLPL